ncbi:MAG: type 2 lanthipeptide synthetase LanM, partial [Candidatus Nanopelagicales bacterium]
MDEFANWMIRAAFTDQLAQTRSQLRNALSVDVVSEAVVDEWIDHLVHNLAAMAVRSLSRDLSATLMIKGIAVADPTSADGRTRLAPHLADLGVRFQREYPEGVRLYDLLTARCVANAIEFHDRFAAHQSELVAEFGEHWRQPLARVQAGAGDRHNGGKTVVIMTAQSGQKLVYKPRPMEPEVRLDRLLAVTAEAIGDSTWRKTGVLVADGYGYMNFVEHADCADLAAVGRFYRRAGMLLALAHAIGMNDLHTENVVASGDTPIVIDAETLLPARCRNVPGVFSEPATEYFLASVLAPGLLPRWAQVYRQRVNLGPALGYELGGLGRPELLDSSVIAGAGHQTDSETPPSFLFDTASATNLPTIDGEVVPAAEFIDEVVTGFTETLDVILKWRDEWLAVGGPLDEVLSTPVRVIPRNTSLYASAINASTAAPCLRNADTRLARLRARLGSADSASTALISTELTAMTDLDVPMFHADAESRSTSHGGVKLFESPREAALRRLGRLESERSASIEIVRASLATPFAEDDVAWGAAGDRQTVGRTPGSRVREVINEIADTIVDQAIVAEPEASIGGQQPVSWMSQYRDQEWRKSVFTPLGPGLMQGSMGIALFLAQVAYRLDRPELRPIAAGAAWNAVRLIANQHDSASPDTGAITDLGFADGLGGVIWGLSELSELWRDQELLEVARGLTAMVVPEAVPRVERVDFAGGLAGSLVGLCRLQHATSRVSPAFSGSLAVSNQSLEALVARISDLMRDADAVTSFAGDVRLGAATGTAGLCFALARVSGTHRDAYDLAQQLASGLTLR